MLSSELSTFFCVQWRLPPFAVLLEFVPSLLFVCYLASSFGVGNDRIGDDGTRKICGQVVGA